MKKIFFICCIAISVLALTSASLNKHQYSFNDIVLSDTTPRPMLDTAPNTWKDTARNNMMKDTGIVPKRDSTKPPPPHY